MRSPEAAVWHVGLARLGGPAEANVHDGHAAACLVCSGIRVLNAEHRRHEAQTFVNSVRSRVAVDFDGEFVTVRDGVLGENGPVLHFTREEWEAFLEGVRQGEFDQGALGTQVAPGQD